MQVRVLLFGVLKDLLASESIVMELPEEATAGQLVERCMASAPQARKFSASLAVAVNREYAASTQILRDGDEIALLPPVSGGSAGASESAGTLVRLQRAPILAEDILAKLKDGEDGAVVVFDGIVRNHTRGRKTLHLDYEAYEEMARSQMEALAREAKQRFAVREVALVHRLGRLQVGESSVWIAVAAAHRAAAFEACRWIIDTLKTTVPIWKKEHFLDGAVWADGEPFPSELSM